MTIVCITNENVDMNGCVRLAAMDRFQECT